MVITLTSLEQALGHFAEAIEFANSDIARKDKRLFKQFRYSVILCFEFTYGLCWRTLKKQLEEDSPTSTIINELNYNDMMREAAIRGLVADPVIWMDYRKQRNNTSHVYNAKLAQEVYETALNFYKDAERLLNVLLERNR